MPTEGEAEQLPGTEVRTGTIELSNGARKTVEYAVVDGVKMWAGRAAPMRIGPTGSASPNTFTIW